MSSVLTPTTTPSKGPWNSQWQPEWGRCRAPVITEATGATCPVPRAGRWRFGSARAGGQYPRRPQVYGVPPGHRQPPLGRWRWAKQPGSLPPLRWWLPASVALPRRWKKRICFSSFHCFSLKSIKQINVNCVSWWWSLKRNYLLYDKSSSLSFLLSHLLHFNSLCKLFAKG